MTVHAPAPAADAYDALAATYDLFTAGHEHDRWLAALEERARRLGLPGRRVLDVACGTVKSFEPLLARGYAVDACDLSPAMAAEARRRHPDPRAHVWAADMRDLGATGPYDLLTCLDDAVNYLLDPADLGRAFAEAARVLAPGGLYVFDVNTLRTYREAFGRHAISERDGTVFCWRGGAADARPGSRHEAVLDVFGEGEGRWARVTSVHVQRHHPRADVLAALQAAGLDCVAALGQRTGAQLHDAPDEERDTKAVYFARLGGSHPGTREEVPDADHRPHHRSVTEPSAAVPYGGGLIF